ncbi:MAG: hypothetical protein QXQ39_06730 [Conexivisphaerales archaeon]
MDWKDIFQGKYKVINVGLEIFYDSLQKQGVQTVHVEWNPPVKLEKELEDILSKLI